MLCSVCTLLNGNAQAGSAIEPSLSRRKKHPDLPYRTHELLFDYEEGESSDSLDAGGSLGALATGKGDADSRARIPDAEIEPSTKPPTECENAAKKTDEKQPLMTQSYPPSTNPRGNPGTPGDESIPKTTEYRSQFVAWPLAPGETVSTARKSASMGFITPQMIKKDLTDKETDGPSAELWSVRPEGGGGDDDDAALDAVKRGRIKKTEYKSKFRPFSAYTYVDGGWKKATKLIKDHDPPSDVDPNSWYCEVVERLKKADQYRVRSHGGGSLYGEQQLPPELLSHMRDRTVLSPVSVASTSRTWKDERPSKERPRPAPVPVHHRREKKEITESPEHSKSREGSTKKKSHVEKTTVRPKSAEPVIPHTKENKSPKHQPKTTRPRAPRDLPVHGHGDLSGRKKAARQAVGSPHARPAEKSSPMGSKPRAVPRPGGAPSAVNGDDGKIWMKPASSKADEEGPKSAATEDPDAVVMNGFPESGKEHGDMVNGEVEDSVHNQRPREDDSGRYSEPEEPCPRPITKPPIRVPLTTVKSPEEVTGVRSPDPESWTVPLEIGKGLHWMDGKTPDGASQKTPPILLSKRFKEPAIAAKGQRDLVLCDPGSASEDVVDL